MTGSASRLALALAALSGFLPAACGTSDPSPDTTQPSAAEISRLERLPQAAVPSGEPPGSTARDPDVFLREVFNDAESFWRREFSTAGLDYRPSMLTVFRDEVETGCGKQPAQAGPFYCPADGGVYLNPRFFAALSARTGVRLGRFAQAYVIAHELGHHVQTQLSLTSRKAAADKRDPAGANARSVRFELQADCLAGVWMHSAYRRGSVTDADIQDALRAAAVVGSDFQQFNSTGTIRPEDWTHGSSAERRHWLTVGFEQGRPAVCEPAPTASTAP